MKYCPSADVEKAIREGNTDEVNDSISYYNEYINAWNPSSISLEEMQQLERAQSK